MRFHPTTLLVLLCAVTAAAQTGRPDVPQVEPGLARIVPASPVPAGFIADVPDVIPADAEAALNSRIAAVQAGGRGDIGVAVLPSLEGRTPAEVGVAIYRIWRIGRIDSIGSARRNLGVLLLIVPKELAPDKRGHCWITTGRGAEGIVTDAASARICRERVVPHLIKRDYGAAVAAGLDGLQERLDSDEALAAEPFSPESDTGGSGGSRWWFIPAGLVTFIAGLFGAVRWRRARPRRCLECGLTMRRAAEREGRHLARPGAAIGGKAQERGLRRLALRARARADHSVQVALHVVQGLRDAATAPSERSGARCARRPTAAPARQGTRTRASRADISGWRRSCSRCSSAPAALRPEAGVAEAGVAGAASADRGRREVVEVGPATDRHSLRRASPRAPQS